MATVRITKELINDTVDIARAQFSEPIAKAKEAKPEDKWGDYIYDQLFGKYYHTMKELPSQFLPQTTVVSVYSVGGIHCDLRFTLSEEKPMPAALPYEVVPEIAERRWNGQYDLKDHLVWGELYAEVKAWSDKVEALKKRQREFETGVRTVLGNFSTLAPAIKEWPPLWELLPQWAKDKHKEVTVREKKSKGSVDSDVLGKLTGAITAVKLGGL